jgi:signal peptidase I
MIVWPPSRWHILRIPATFEQPGIDGPVAGLAGQALGSPAASLAGGLAGALPLTLMRRRLRRRRLARRRVHRDRLTGLR